MDQVRDQFLKNNPGSELIGGGRDKDGNEKPEEYISLIGKEMAELLGGKITTKGGKYADMTFKLKDGRIVRVQTVDIDAATGKPSMRELNNALEIFKRTNQDVILVPKPK